MTRAIMQPSAEAIEAGVAEYWRSSHSAARHAAASVGVERVIRAAYAIGAPAIHAAGVQEGRAAMLREFVEWLREEAYVATCFDPPGVAEFYRRAADVVQARFPSEGTTDG